MYSEKVTPSLKRGHIFMEAVNNVKDIKITVQDKVKYTVLKGDKVILKADASEIPPPTISTSSGEVCNSYVSCGNSFSEALNSNKPTTLDRPNYKPKTGKEYKMNKISVIPNIKDLKIIDLAESSDYTIQQIYDMIYKEIRMKSLKVRPGQEDVTLGEVEEIYGINPKTLYDKFMIEPDTQEITKPKTLTDIKTVKDLSEASGKSVQQIYDVIYKEMGMMESIEVRPGDEDMTLQDIEFNYGINPKTLYDKFMIEPDTQEIETQETSKPLTFSNIKTVKDLSEASGKSVQQIYDVIYKEMGMMESAKVRPGDEDITLQDIEDNYGVNSETLYDKIF